MYKKAQSVALLNPDMTARIFGKMRQREYSETVAVLSEIHSIISARPDEAILVVTEEVLGDSGFAKNFAKYITNYIGEEAFRSSDFSYISSALDELRPKPSVLVEAPVPLPEEDAPTEEVIPVSIEEEAPTEEVIPLDKPDFSKEVERVLNQAYPDDKLEDYQLSVKNLNLHLQSLKEANSQQDVDETAEQIRGTIEWLDELSALYIEEPLEEEPDKGPVVLLSGSEERKITSEIVSPAAEGGAKEHQDILSRVIAGSATLSSETASAHAILSGIQLIPDGGLSAENIHEAENTLKVVLERAKEAFIGISKRVFDNVAIDRYKGAPRELIIEFNNLIYTIKFADLTVIKGIAESLDASNEFLSKVGSLKESLLTTFFSSNKGFFDEYIGRSMVWVSNRSIGLMYMNMNKWEDQKRRDSKDNPFQDLVDLYQEHKASGVSLNDDTVRTIGLFVWRKFQRELSLEGQDLTSAGNFLSKMMLNKRFLYMYLKKNASFVKRAAATDCPVCARPINWDVYNRDTESIGNLIPLYSIFSKVRNPKTKRFRYSIITEEKLKAGGPYPPPDPKQYRHTKGGKLSAKLVASYEGDKTWGEIQELLYSNNRRKHIEGLHRKAAAFAHLNAEPLKGVAGKCKCGAETKIDPVTGQKERVCKVCGALAQSDTYKVQNIKAIMFGCPFEAKKTKDAEGKDLDLEIERVKNVNYADPLADSLLQELESLESELAFIKEDEDVGAVYNAIKAVIKKLDAFSGDSGGAGGVAFSGCGLKMTSYGESSREMSYGANANPRSLDYVWSPEALSEEQASFAKEKMSGGFKFSRTLFRCPARIENPSSSDLKIYKNLAIPKAGPVGMGRGFYAPPVKADGIAESEELSEGTFSYLICGANTSLSSFDRTATGTGSIFYILKTLFNTFYKGVTAAGTKASKTERFLAKDMLDFFVTKGVDNVDLVRALEIGRNTELETKSARELRLEKIGKLLIQASVDNPHQFRQIEDLILACPHGHKFSIKQSFAFGESHSSINIQGFKRGSVLGRKLYSLTGRKSLEMAKEIGLIVPAVDADRVVSFDQIMSGDFSVENAGFVLIDENGEESLWKFSSSALRGIKKSAFFIENGRQKAFQKMLPYASINLGASFTSDIVQIGDDEISAADMAVAMRSREGGDSSQEGRLITGVSSDDFAGTTKALGKALKAILKIIVTWNNRTLDQDFLQRVRNEVDFDATIVIESLFNSGAFNDVIEYYDENSDVIPLPSEVKNAILKNIADRFKSYVISTKAFHSEELLQSASILLTSAIVDCLEQMQESDSYLDFDYEADFYNETLNNKVLPFLTPIATAYAQAKAKIREGTPRSRSKVVDLIKQTPEFEMFYQIDSFDESIMTNTLTKMKKSVRGEYAERIFLVAFAQTLAKELVGIYFDHMISGKSIEYIGYPVGLDLGSVNKILSLGIEDIDSIREDITLKDLEFDIRMHDELQELFLDRIRSVYNKIKGVIGSSRKFAITPAGLETAKNEFLRKSGDDLVSHSVFSAFFPTTTIGFESWRGPGFFIPDSFGKLGNIPTLEGINGPVQIPLVDSGGNILKTRGGEDRLMNIYAHMDSGYDGSKFQVGAVSGKTNVSVTWPLVSAQGHTGALLPIPGAATAGNVAASGMLNLQITDYRFVVEIDGTPQDVTFLFRRGRDEIQRNKIKELYERIDKSEVERSRQLERAENDEEKDGINNYFDEYISKINNIISSVPLFIKASKSLLAGKKRMDGTTEWKGMPHPSATLIDPEEALDILKYPHRYSVGLSTPFNKALIRKFIVGVYNLDLVREIFEAVHNKLRPVREFSIEDVMNFHLDRDVKDDKKLILALNRELKKRYQGSLGQFFNLLPSARDGSGSYVNVMTASSPQFLVDKRAGAQEGGYGVYFKPNTNLGNSPSINDLHSRLAQGEHFGISKKKKEEHYFTSKAADRMMEFFNAYTTSDMPSRVLRAEDGSEYFSKIAKRQELLWGMMLSMGHDDLVGPE